MIGLKACRCSRLWWFLLTQLQSLFRACVRQPPSVSQANVELREELEVGGLLTQSHRS
jgi:hypothetical protein